MKHIVLAIGFMLMVTAVFANKTSVKVVAPESIKKGQELTVIVQVSHKGNSKMHHTNWVTLSVNGQEVKRWEFSGKSLPPEANFNLEYKFIPTGNCTITAKGNCNLHGSAGPDTVEVKVE